VLARKTRVLGGGGCELAVLQSRAGVPTWCHSLWKSICFSIRPRCCRRVRWDTAAKNHYVPIVQLVPVGHS
jgi:hypothetical protein